MAIVSWSESAKIDYWKNIDYLENEWTILEVVKFIDDVDHLIEMLSNENVIFQASNYKNVFQVPVIEQITLYYRVENGNVELLRFWNNYKDLRNFSLK